MKDKLLKALDEVQDGYDAYYISNKYGECTHKEQFDMLFNAFKGDKVITNALAWVKGCYDCYYKNEHTQVFDEIRNAIKYLGD